MLGGLQDGTRVTESASWMQSFLLLWGPWLPIFGMAVLGVFALVLLLRRLMRGHDAIAMRCLIAAALLALCAFVDAIALGYVANRGTEQVGWVVGLGALLLLLLLGLMGCGATALWRLISSQRPA